MSCDPCVSPCRCGQTGAASPDALIAWARRVSRRGSDVPLQVLTAGLRDFQVERRTDGGSWVLVKSSTTATSMTGTFRRGHRYQFPIRARDRAGNVGSSTAPVGISV